MKKIFGLAALSLVFVLSGCDEGNTYEESAKLAILMSDVQFDADEAEGFIEADAQGTLTVESNQSWCIPTVFGNTVTVKVARNGSIEGRYATLRLSDGKGSALISVSQQGMHLDVSSNHLIIPDHGGSDVVVYDSNVPVVISDMEGGTGWLNRTVDGNRISFTANSIRNDYFGVREATMTVTATMEDGRRLEETITVTQARPLTYEDMLEGTWQFAYTELDGQRTVSSAELRRNGEDNTSFEFYGILSTANTMAIMDFDPTVGDVSFKSGQVLTYANILGMVLEGVMVAGDRQGTYSDVTNGIKTITRASDVEYMGRMNGLMLKSEARFTFGDNGSWPGHVVRGLDRAYYMGGQLADIFYSYYDCELYRQ